MSNQINIKIFIKPDLKEEEMNRIHFLFPLMDKLITIDKNNRFN